MVGLHPLLAIAVATFAIAMTATAQAQTKSQEPLWSLTPRKVDRSEQSFERLPAAARKDPAAIPERYSLRLGKVPYKVLDSASFVQSDVKYHLAGLSPVDPKRTCRNAEGERWACGLRSRVALTELLRGSRVRCAPLGEADGVTIVECMRGKIDIGAALVAKGHAVAASGDDRYREEAEKARSEKQGVWADSAVAGN